MEIGEIIAGDGLAMKGWILGCKVLRCQHLEVSSQKAVSYVGLRVREKFQVKNISIVAI